MMDSAGEIVWAEYTPPIIPTPVSAAKLSVLNLAPIKERLGSRWGRLSDLVHKLFEKALRGAQGPRDHFVLVGELSYVATFHGVTPDEAGLACAAIAKAVCELLFGEDSETISVRSLIGTVSGPILQLPENAGAQIAQALEQNGKETIISSQKTAAAQHPREQGYWVEFAHGQSAVRFNQETGLYPIWNLHKKRSQWLMFGRNPRHSGRKSVAAAQRNQTDDNNLAELEIAFLRAAAEYGLKVQQTRQLCAISAGVSYSTLSGFHTRIRYIQALKSIAVSGSCPLFLQIGQIPEGTPLGRLAEIVAMISEPGTRVLLEFENIRRVPVLDIRLGVAGIGTALPDRCDCDEARKIAENLLRRSVEQKAFAFLERVDSSPLIGAIFDAGIHYASGAAPELRQILSGLEAVPKLPMALPAKVPTN
jgi:hypothetical protein